MASRLAEIMGQGSISTSDDVSADEIPYASAEELEAGKLAPSSEVVSDGEDLLVSDEIPNQVRNDEESVDGAECAESEVTLDGEVTSECEEVIFEMDDVDYPSCIDDYFYGIGRYETLAFDSDEEKTLYVFASSLNPKNNFSSKLISCCRRLASVHNYSQVKLLNNSQIIEEKKDAFAKFMREKNVVYACSSSLLSLMTEEEKSFCELIGIPLDKESLEAQLIAATDKNAPFMKLLIQDIIE